MPIYTTNDIPINHPEIKYDKYLINFTAYPVVSGNNIEAGMTLTMTPYRELPDGTLDVKEDAKRVHSNSACFATAETDPVMATALNDIFFALGTYIAAKGL